MRVVHGVMIAALLVVCLPNVVPATGGDAAVHAGRAPSTPHALRWPLDLPPAVVSSFGEYRYDHMHAGVDLSTGGGVGQPVRAADDGSVYRLKVEWRGYGRALYLRHTDGRVSVYGHLERYENAVLGLENQVKRRQQEAHTRYPGDIYLEPPLPVRRGQIVAFSGESGAGLPHLHFEMRAAGDEPIDPFHNGLPLPPDRQPPVLESFIVTVSGAEAWIDGVLREKVIPLAGRGPVREATEPLRVSGPFRADVSGWAPSGGGRAGLRFLETRVDGQVCYRLDFDRFRFDQYPLSGLIFDHRFSHIGPTRMAWRLSALPGNALAEGRCDALANDAEAEAGAFLLPDGAHVFEVTARDAAGVESRARLCILAGRPGVLPGVRPAGPHDPGTVVLHFDASPSTAPARQPDRAAEAGCSIPPWRVEGGVWSGRRFAALECEERAGLCSATSAAPPADARPARVRQIAGGVPGPWSWLPGDRQAAGAMPVSLTFLPAFLDVVAGPMAAGDLPAQTTACALGLDWRPIEGLRLAAGLSYARLAAAAPLAPSRPDCPVDAAAASLVVRAVSPAQAATVEGDGFRVEVPAGGRFFTGPLAVMAGPAPEVPAGLWAVGNAVEILPDGECLNARGTLAFRVPADRPDLQPLGIYRRDAETGRWSFEGDDVDPAARTIVLPFRRYGHFALLQDESPPVIRSLHPGAGARVTRRRPEIVAAVEDVGEGFNFDGVAFLLDGRPLESEFDPDRGTARPFDPPSLSAGRHHLRVQARDRAGNLSEPMEVDFEAR